MKQSFSCKRLLNVARVVISSIYKLLATNWDLTRLSSFVLMVYEQVANILMQSYLQSVRSQDVHNSNIIRSEMATVVSIFFLTKR